LVDTFLDSVAEEDILMEVVREADLASLEELSFKNSLAEFKDFGGEEDLELALEDFLEDAVDVFEVFLIEVVELFLVEVADDWPSLIIPRLIASSSSISFPVSGSVKMPVFSSIRPLRRASWNVIIPSSPSPMEETFIVLRTVWVTVAVVTVMFSRLFKMAATKWLHPWKLLVSFQLQFPVAQ
jgi:hypothetical protein